MSKVTILRPNIGEYAPYYEEYIALVSQGDVLDIMSQQLDDSLILLRGIPEAQGCYRYAPEKWSIKEVVGHVIDTERVFGYRALCIARNDRSPLPGFEQDDYVRSANFNSLQLHELAEEFASVRKANLYLFRHLDEDAWLRRGVANNNEVSVRALACIMAGHEAHHMRIIRTKYL